MELPPNYNNDNMLIGANNLNNQIKAYLNRNSIPDDNQYNLEEFKLDIEEYLRDIPPYNFRPRTDGLTKEGIIGDLEYNLSRINEELSRIGRRNTGGKSSIRKVKKTRKVKRNRKVKKTRQVKRRQYIKRRTITRH
jgi:hypothetical protein